MRLKMQTFMLLGAKRFDTVPTLKTALESEKVNWFPIFKDNTCQGQLQIKTQFIKESVLSILNGGDMVFEGGKDKKDGWTVQRVRTGILCAGLATAATVGIWAGFEDQMSGMTEEQQTQLAAIGTVLGEGGDFDFEIDEYFMNHSPEKNADNVWKSLGHGDDDKLTRKEVNAFLEIVNDKFEEDWYDVSPRKFTNHFFTAVSDDNAIDKEEFTELLARLRGISWVHNPLNESEDFWFDFMDLKGLEKNPDGALTEATNDIFRQLAKSDYDEGLNKAEYREFFNEWRRQLFEQYQYRPTPVDSFDKMWKELGIADDGIIDRHEFYQQVKFVSKKVTKMYPDPPEPLVDPTTGEEYIPLVNNSGFDFTVLEGLDPKDAAIKEHAQSCYDILNEQKDNGMSKEDFRLFWDGIHADLKMTEDRDFDAMWDCGLKSNAEGTV